MLKRAGVPQESEAYWYGVIPSLTTIQGMTAIAQEDKGKMRWLLILGKPQEPSASAFTLEELQKYLKQYIEIRRKHDPFYVAPETPQLRKQEAILTNGKKVETSICSINGQEMFNATNDASAFAQAILYIVK